MYNEWLIWDKTQDKTEVQKQKVIVTSAAVVTTEFLFGICDCKVNSNVGKGSFFSSCWEVSMCMDTCMCKCLSLNMDCI